MSLPDGRLRTNGLGLHDAGHGIWAACQTRQWAPGPDGRLRKYQPVADSSAPAPTHTAMAHPTTTWLPSCPAAAGPVAAKSCQSALRALRMREQDDRVGTWCRQSGWLCGRAPPCACIAHPLQSWTRTCVLGTWTVSKYTPLRDGQPTHAGAAIQCNAVLLCSARHALPPATPAFGARLPALPLRYHH